MMRWFLFLVLALWAVRWLRPEKPRPRQPTGSEFHPGDGAGHPSGVDAEGAAGGFSTGDIVDGEFEDIPGPPHP